MLPDLKTQNEIAMRELGLEIPIEEVYNANGLSLKDLSLIHILQGWREKYRKPSGRG